MSDDRTTSAVPIAYGDIILINSPFNDHLTLFSDGIVKSQIYLKNFGSGTRKKSFYRSMFQIYPSFTNTHKTQALAVKERKGIVNGVQLKKEKLEELKEKLNFEYKFNLEHFEKVRNTPVAYGNSVQFLHIASNKFLACHFVEAEIEKENYRLELVDIPSEASNFKISPSYKHQKENEGFIYYKDLIYINCANNYLNKTPYLHCNYHFDQTAAALSIKKTYDSERLSQDSPPKRRTSSNARSSHSQATGLSLNQNMKSEDMAGGERKPGKKEINVSLNKCRWKMNLFSHENQDKAFLSYGNIIWMNHAEHNASMIARKEKNGEVDFVKTIIADATQQYSGNTNGMWIIENQVQSTGGLLEWEDEFRLKHLSSGKYLSIDYSHLKKKHILKLEAEKNEDSLFKFELMPTLMTDHAAQNYKNVNKEAYIRIRSAATKLWLHVDQIGDRLEGCLLPEVIDDDIFKLFKANSNEIWETSFLISCFPILQNYLVGLEETSGKVVIVDEQTAYHKIEKRAKEAQECLIQLELFCTNRLLNTSPDQKYGEVNPYRQKVLREQYFLETLGEILKYSFTEAQIENYLIEKENQEELKGKKGHNLQKLVRKAKVAAGKGNDFFLMEQKIVICRLIYRLFKSICKDNAENELYAYHIIDQFQYHAKYLEEAVDCFISIVNSNESLLTRLGEEIKVQEVLEQLSQPAGAAPGPKKKIKLFNLSLALGIKDPNDYESQNFITYFLKLIHDNPITKRNLSYLRFLKNICVCDEKGITINQEHLYKIFAASQTLDKSTFMETIIGEDSLCLRVNDGSLVSLSECFKLDTQTPWRDETKYFLEQVGFYSNLLEGRNYLWKMRLEQQFPAHLVFEQIYNEKLSLEIRSVFCDLALALYIDQEPLNPRIVPNLCRVFKKKTGNVGSFGGSAADNTHKLAQIDKANFAKLLENIVKIVADQKKKINDDLQEKCEGVSEAKLEMLKVDNYLNNIVLAKLIKLLCKMVSFDLFLLLDGKANYYQIIQDLIHILEFDKANPATSYALMKLREENYKKNVQEGKMKVFGMLGDLAGVVGDFSKDLVGNIKNVAGAVFGAEKKKGRADAAGMEEEGDDALYVNNPVMKGLILLRNQMDQLNTDSLSEANTNEIMIKGEICDLMNYMLDLRHDFLISNLLGWYEDVVPQVTGKQPHEVDPTLVSVIDREVGSIFPDISKTGQAEVDAKYKPKEENVLDGLKNIVKTVNIAAKKNAPPVKLTKFAKYTEEEEFPDIDTLFTGVNMTGKKEILPSLLTTFYLTNDTHLENKLLTLIMRIFGQREELFDNMQKLEMVFERDDVEAYYKLERWSEDLRLQTQRSEIWLYDFIQSKGEKDWELKNVMKLFRDITNLVFGTNEGSDKHIKGRQSMMRNLAAYGPMIGMIRDGAFHLKMALDDPELSEENKQQLLDLFSVAHASLICFCHNNPENQVILSSNMKLFLSNLQIDFGQITLICEICKDNKDVCEEFADVIINGLIDAIGKFGHKASFLDPLTALQKHKTAFLIENHIKILNRFITASRALEENELQALYASLNPDTKEVELTFKKILPLDEPFLYHAKLFDILMFDSEGNETLIFTHSRLRKVFTVPYCLKLVQQISSEEKPPLSSSRGLDLLDVQVDVKARRRSSLVINLPQKLQNKFEVPSQAVGHSSEGFRLLKPKVLRMLGTLYLKGDKILAEEFLEHLDLFVDFVKGEKSMIQGLSEEFRPSPEFTSYLFGRLMYFIKDYVDKLILSNVDEARDRRDSAAILELVDIVYSKFPALSVKITRDDAGNFRALAKHYIDEANVTNSQVPYMLDAILRTKETQNTRPDEPAPAGPESARKKYVFFESKEAASYSLYWPDFVRCANDSKSLAECIKNERAALAEAIWKFAEIFPKEYKKTYKIELEAKDIVRKLIVFLRDGQKNKADKGTMIATLRVLREIIDSADDVTEMQSFIDKNDGTRMLLTVLSDPKVSSIDDELLNEFFEFGISLLEGGNQNVQKTIYSFCTVYSMSQIMFAKFHSIIYDQIHYLQAKADLKTDSVKILELEQAHGLKSEILERLLRFLQLFTEGHYQELQDYLRHQTNSRNRYNLVEAVIELLKTYSSDLVQANYENIIKCLDTLNEFVQGPCQENQIALVDGKFFDVVLTLFNKKVRSAKQAKDRKKSKSTPESAKKPAYLIAAYLTEGGAAPAGQAKELEPWMLARLKYKVLILVNSLLERSSKSVIKRVMRSLPLDVLQKNLIKIFKKYKELYGDQYVMESLKHFEGDPTDKDDPNYQIPGYYELITESGFMIYFLICSYTDMDTQDIDDELLNEINDFKEEDESMHDKLKSSVFGQLATFGYTFISSLAETGNDMRKSFEKRFRKTKKVEIKENEEERRIKKSLERKQLNKESMQFFGRNSGSIEVARMGEIERIQFMLMPFCHDLPREERKAFHESVDRQNPKTKVEGLVEESERIIEVCKHELKLKIFFNKRKFIALFTNFVNLWKDLAFLMSLVINLFILTSYSDYFGDEGDIDGGRMSDPELFLSSEVSTETTITIFQALGIVMAFCSIFVLFFFLLKRAPLILKKALEEKSMIMKGIKIVFYSLQSIDIVYYIAYGVLAVIGTVFHPFFFSFHLTEILFRYPTLKNVIKSVWIPRKQLSLTFVLFFVLTYFFSLYAYAYMDDVYEGNCESTLLCFKTTYDGTFKANGGIGGWEKARERDDFNTERFIYDNLANIILLIIMVNIVSGIIIDTFGLLREQEEEKNEDIEEKCFICGLDKDVFDRQADTSYNFNVHIRREHHMWNYVFFIAYLRDKDETEYTGIESYISDKIKDQDLTWFPFNRALALKHHEEEESENTKEAFDHFYSEADEIKKSIKALNEAYTSLTTRMNIN